MAYKKKSNAIQNHSSNKSQEAVELFASMMIERMEALKNENWRKGWFNGVSFEGFPENYSGRTYNAGNAFFLNLLTSAKGYSLPVYMTFKQAMDNGVSINKGEKSFPVVYWDFTVKDKDGNKISYIDYRQLDKEEQKKYDVIPFLKYYNVFNVDQTNLKEVKPEKYEALKVKFEIPEIKDSEGMYTHRALDKMIADQSWYCPIQADKLSQDAYYSPSHDIVVLPMKEQFKTHNSKEDIYVDGMQFYSTMLHEVAHSTKGPGRLGRESGRFGDPKYAKEELVAELTAAMIGCSMGFDSSITDNSAIYLDSWLGALRENPNFIISVMADVNKAAEMILEKVDEKRLELGEKPYLSKNLVAVDNGYSLEPEFKPVNELLASEPEDITYGQSVSDSEEKPLLLKQFEEMKAKHPDALLLFRVGDCYELLSQDAVKASEILGTVLTPRNPNYPLSVDMTVFPHNALETYLPKLVKAGQRVAICEQLINPKLTKKLDKRGINENNLINNNNMASKKKSEEPVAEIQEKQAKSFESLSMEEKSQQIQDVLKDLLKDQRTAIISTLNSEKLMCGDINEMMFRDGVINYHEYLTANHSFDYIGYCLQNNKKPSNTVAKNFYEKIIVEENIRRERKGYPSLPDNIKELDNKMKAEKEIVKKQYNNDAVVSLKYLTTGVISNISQEKLNLLVAELKAVNVTISNDILSHTEQNIKDEKKEETIKQPREPQMVTVNGDIITHGHIMTSKDKEVPNKFVARLNDKWLMPIPVSKQTTADYLEGKITAKELIEQCYPTKIMPKVAPEEYKFPCTLETPQGNITIERFNPYKESNQNSQDFGKYKFFAEIDGKNMSALADQASLNEYFDRVKTPAQIVEKIFGEKLHLASHYEQYKLPEYVKFENVAVFKPKDQKQYLVMVEIAGVGKKAKPISSDDCTAFYNEKTATKEQLAAKYLSGDIAKMLANPQQKLEKSQSQKL